MAKARKAAMLPISNTGPMIHASRNFPIRMMSMAMFALPVVQWRQHNFCIAVGIFSPSSVAFMFVSCVCVYLDSVSLIFRNTNLAHLWICVPTALQLL